MILRDGKFYDGEREIPLQFGNRLQIELINNAMAEAEKGALVELNIKEVCTYTMSFNYKCCNCFKVNNHGDWQTYEDFEPSFDDEKEMIEDNLECEHCGAEHRLVVDKKTNQYRPKYFLKLDTQSKD
jgi:DNA-directed RNA polymerase subunit RPC12/RpoP